MLPPQLASLCFVDADLGSDAALAARSAAAVPGARIMLLGASRPGLTRALVAAGLDVVVVDSSRTALRRARDELAGAAGVLLLAADPRELEIPGGVDAVLVPSAMWRAITLPTDRRHVLRAMAKELRPDGALLLDLERLPDAPERSEPLPGPAGAVRWRRAVAEDAVVVSVADADVRFSVFSPESAVAEALDEGFDTPALTDARTGGAAGPATPVVWARLRTARGRA